MFEKKSPPKPGDFQNKCQIEPKTQIIFVMVNSVYPISGLCLVTLFGLSEKILFYYIQVDKMASSQVSMLYRLSHRPYSKPTFYGNEVGIGLRFPLKIRLIQYLFIKEDSFFEIKCFLPCGGVCAEWLITPWAPVLEVRGSSLSCRVVSLDKELCLSSPRCINGYWQHTAVG